MTWAARIPTFSSGNFYPGWGLAFDFVNGLYRVGFGSGSSTSWGACPGVTYTRTGADLLSYNPATGKWAAYAAGVPPIMAQGGQDVPEGTTNKCTNFNAAPDAGLTGVTKSGDAAATLTRVDDTAALRAAGFGDLIDAGKMPGLVYKLDNTLGTVTAFATVSGQTGNTNAHYLSVVARAQGATGQLRCSGAGAEGNATINVASGYSRVAAALAPAASTRTLQIQVNPGGIVYFILNQLEEKTYATNPVIVSGASATRGNAQPVVTGLASILTPPFTLVAVANLSAIDGVNRTLAGVFLDSSNRVDIRRNSSNAVAVAPVGGTGAAPASFLGRTGPRLLKVAARFRSNEMSLCVDGGGPNVSVATIPPGMMELRLGNINSANFLNSPLLFVGIAPDLTDAQLQAITASNGALADFL